MLATTLQSRTDDDVARVNSAITEAGQIRALLGADLSGTAGHDDHSARAESWNRRVG